MSTLVRRSFAPLRGAHALLVVYMYTSVRILDFKLPCREEANHNDVSKFKYLQHYRGPKGPATSADQPRQDQQQYRAPPSRNGSKVGTIVHRERAGITIMTEEAHQWWQQRRCRESAHTHSLLGLAVALMERVYCMIFWRIFVTAKLHATIDYITPC